MDILKNITGNWKGKIYRIRFTHNRSSYLKRTIQSVLDQNCNNIEIIIVDDASTDNTKKIAQSFNEDRIIYIKNEKRMGANFSRNIGLKKARGTYIAFLDDDDYYCDKNKLRKQIELFKKNNKLGFVGCGYFDKLINKERMPNIRGKIDKKLLISFSDIETSTIMIKKEVIDKAGFLDETLPSNQNHDFFYRISKIAEFDYLPEIAVIKDAPPTQISTNITNKLKGHILFHKKHFNDIKKLGYKLFIFIMIKFVISIFIFLLANICRSPTIPSKLYEMVTKKLK